MRKKTKVNTNNKTVKLPISRFIDTRFRDYALYVISGRGIPNFYDALTPVQRYILMNAPVSFNKTLSVVGKAIEAGYHHGNLALEKSIARLARPFGASMQILDGYGFFGSEVSPDPAAARYTSVKIGKKPAEILKKYKHLFTKSEDSYDPFWTEIPIGLTTQIVGIAVGYKTMILPRKLEDIKSYLEGKRKSVKPHFKDFNGTIKKYNNIDKSWVISSNVKIEDNKIEIRELPPVLKYASALKKLDWLFSRFEGKIRILNNSNTKVNIDIKYIGKDNIEWQEIQEYIKKAFSVIVTESPVFVKDGQVLVYERVEDYLDDYKWQILRLKFNDAEYRRDWTSSELLFNEAKKKFITFILQKKRTIKEVDEFLKPFTKEIKSRLESLTSKKFTQDELAVTVEKIKELKRELKMRNTEYKNAKKIMDKNPDPTLVKGISSKKSGPVDLFEDEEITESEGVSIWSGDDVYDKKQELVEMD